MISSNDPASTEAINGIQRGLQCCGNNGPTDWTLAVRAVPDSCCAPGSVCTVVTAFPNGCGTMLSEIVRTSGMLIAWIAVVFGAFEVKI